MFVVESFPLIRGTEWGSDNCCQGLLTGRPPIGMISIVKGSFFCGCIVMGCRARCPVYLVLHVTRAMVVIAFVIAVSCIIVNAVVDVAFVVVLGHTNAVGMIVVDFVMVVSITFFVVTFVITFIFVVAVVAVIVIAVSIAAVISVVIICAANFLIAVIIVAFFVVLFVSITVIVGACSGRGCMHRCCYVVGGQWNRGTG